MTPTLLNNRYRIIRALGTGGFGETFLAEDTHMPSRRICVIKQLKPVANNPQVYQLVQERFQREAAILEQLGEGNEQIPRLHAYFEEQGQFYLVQEWIEGFTLSQKLQQQGLLSEDLVKEILASLLLVLDYIHAKGIIHRDIKPSNIILRQQDDKPVLIDFGIAKEIIDRVVDAQGDISQSIAVGTLGYMPPEQAAGKPVYASDIYSLGLTAIYLLTGKRPQDFHINPQTGEMMWDADALGFSPNLVEVLDKAVRCHSSDRYPDAKTMLSALQPHDQALPHAQKLSISDVNTINFAEIPTSPLPSVRQEKLEPRIPHSRQEYRHRQILINKVKNYWIKGVLETSLHGKALIELGLEKRLDAIDRPWGIVWETADQPRQTLSKNTRVIDLFNQMGEGRTLLILGEPGAGKTTTLLELARDLIDFAEKDVNQPISVVFNLSAWTNAKEKIADWLIRELNTKYQVSKEIGKNWIKEQQLLLLLDGLDEVSAERREHCVEAINQFSQEYGQTEIVVCSRLKDYELLSNRLRFQGAVFIQPLTLEQIYQYLKSTGTELAALNTALQADTTLQELAKSPLILSIMTLAYQGMSITDLPGLNLEERRQHLFDKYIQRMFERRSGNTQYSKEQAIHWLSWLAKRLVEKSQTVFLIERIQPSWLPTNGQRRMYAVTLGLLIGLSAALGAGIISGHAAGLQIGLIVGLISGLCGFLGAGLIFGVISNQINPVETLKWSSAKAKDNLKSGLVVGLIAGLILGLSSGLVSGLSSGLGSGLVFNLQSGLTDSLISGLRGSLGAWLIFILMRGLMGPGIETSTVPNQGIWQSARNATFFAIVGILGLEIIAGVMGIPLFWGLIIGLFFGMFAAGEACVKHFALRVILYSNGYIPWNYTRFLDWATERILLQKVGGGYIFVHRLLLEHFTQKSNTLK
ncbi:protein kinase [Trichocoleus sp. Lan]|uniref:protein kinase domain-containing protein n=1 Tax=Trichocoleus sp. Lan TaxID=2933927 RepID=UPI003298E8C0